MHCVFVNWKNSAGQTRSFRIGEADTDDGETSGKWKELMLPAGDYFTQISSTRYSVFGVCNKNKLWVWGQSGECSEILPKDEAAGASDCLASREWKVPCLFKWFSDKNLKVLDVKTGWHMAVVLTQNRDGKKEFYGVGKKMFESSNGT